MENPVMIFGAEGLGKAAMEIFTSNGVVVYCLLDDNKELQGKEINAVPVYGPTDNEDYLKILGKKCEAFIAIDDMKYRKSLVDMLIEDKKVMPVNAIHKNASISEFATFGHGNFINSGVVVGPNVKISNHCIVHSNATIEYDAELSDFVQIGAGSIVNSGVKIEKNAFIGSGVIIVSGVTIGKNARVGAGSVVIDSVKDGETVFGNPAKPIKV